jgi:hypothetical protein
MEGGDQELTDVNFHMPFIFPSADPKQNEEVAMIED